MSSIQTAMPQVLASAARMDFSSAMGNARSAPCLPIASGVVPLPIPLALSAIMASFYQVVVVASVPQGVSCAIAQDSALRLELASTSFPTRMAATVAELKPADRPARPALMGKTSAQVA